MKRYLPQKQKTWERILRIGIDYSDFSQSYIVSQTVQYQTFLFQILPEMGFHNFPQYTRVWEELHIRPGKKICYQKIIREENNFSWKNIYPWLLLFSDAAPQVETNVSNLAICPSLNKKGKLVKLCI